jgi:hypothetical protein
MAGEAFFVRWMLNKFRERDRAYVDSLRTQYDFVQLDAQFRRNFRRETIVSLLVGMPAFFAIWGSGAYGLYRLMQMRWHAVGDVQIVVLHMAPLFACFAFGLVLATCMLTLLSLLLDRWIYRDRVAEYTAYCCLRHGYDLVGRSLQMIGLIGVPTLLICLLAMGQYTVVTSQEVVLNPFWGFNETHYPFAWIQSLRERTYQSKERHQPVLRTYHSVLFKDGYEWTSRPWPLAMSPEDTRRGQKIVEYLSQQTGLPIEKAPMDP